MKWCTIALVWIYLVLVVAMIVVIRMASDRWWVATLLLFSPRWVMTVPLILLVPLSLIFHRRSVLILILSAALVIWPFMGLCIPWSRWGKDSSTSSTLHLLTCNVHHKALNLSAMKALIDQEHPDIVALEEWTPSFYPDVFSDDGWHFTMIGELCIASRYSIHNVQVLPHNYGIRCKVNLPTGKIDFFCVHLESPHYPLRDAIGGEPDGESKLEKNMSHRSEEAVDLSNEISEAGPGTIAAGDFNLPSDSVIYRANLAKFDDAFSKGGFGFGYSYHSRWTLTRIDHILTAGDWVCRKCWLGPNVGSPHRPVIGEFELVGKK